MLFTFDQNIEKYVIKSYEFYFLARDNNVHEFLGYVVDLSTSDRNETYECIPEQHP